MNLRVYHLAGSDHALSGVALARMKIARIADLNDPFELLAINMGGNKDFRRAVNAWRARFHEDIGLLCFSLDWQSPVLWSHYADKHRGICLGFDVSDAALMPVSYTAERLALKFEEGKQGTAIDEAFMQEILKTKFKHWEYEREVRMFVKLDPATREQGHYFFHYCDELMLREVILGPRCDIPIERVRNMADALQRSVEVLKARLAFKWFSVVPDERYLTKPYKVANPRPKE